MLIVLAHPNGWSTREQYFMKQALVEVGPEYKHHQITFVTEGEASVHFCMFHSNMDSALEVSCICGVDGELDANAFVCSRIRI